MIFKDIVSFLSELKENNNREWFNEHKPRFQKLQKDFTLIVEMLINEIAQFDRTVSGAEAKKCIFRIYRDVRFSKDKSPYKTNFGAFIVPGGKGSGKAGYYLHIDPEQCFMAGGIYMPPGPDLKKLRTHVMDTIEEFIEITNDNDFKQFYGELYGDKLKNPPKGFPADFDFVEIIKHKSFIYAHNLNQEELFAESGFAALVNGFKLIAPFNQYLNTAFKN